MSIDNEQLNSRFYREWPNIDLDKLQAAMEYVEKEKMLADLADVNIKQAVNGQVLVNNNGKWVPGTTTDGIAVTNHSGLTGLNADDHPQYLNDTRAKSMFYTKQNINSLLSNKEDKEAVSDLLDRVVGLEEKPTVTLEELNGSPTNHTHDSYYSKSEIDSLLSQKANSNHIYSHSGLSELGADNHPQYYNEARASLRFFTKTEVENLLAGKESTTSANSVRERIASLEQDAIASHGLLSGLSNDDHPQYLNTTRADGRYYTKSNIDSLLADKADDSGITTISNRVSTLENAVHNHDSVYYTKSQVDTSLATKASLSHTHPISDITNLQSSLDAKATTSNVTSLTTRVTTLETQSSSVTNEIEKRVQLYPLSEYGFHTVSCPIGSNPNILSLILGKLYLTRVYVPAGNAINKIYFAVKTIGALPNINASGIALYTDAGVMIDSITNNSLFTSTGWKSATLTNTVTAQSTGKFYWIGLLSNFVTLASIYSTAENPWNGGIASHRRNISAALSLTGFPASFNPTSYGTNETVLPLLALGA